MKKDVLRLHLPCDIKYTRLVEEFTRSTMEYIYPGDEEYRNKLGAVMNEVFVNIVKHSETSALDELIRIQFEIDPETFLISIYDYGQGVKIDNTLPPYNEENIGTKIKFREVVDGVVYATILDALSVSFSFEDERKPRKQKTKKIMDKAFLQGHGYGISIITKIMDSVKHTYVGNGKFEWQMVKKI